MTNDQAQELIDVMKEVSSKIDDLNRELRDIKVNIHKLSK